VKIVNSSSAAKHGALILLVLALATVCAAAAYAAKPACGDGICNGKENATSCPADCGPVADVCGDGICGLTETPESCPGDCAEPPPAACNDDGVCNAGEDCLGCADCAGKTGGSPKNRYCCGLDGFCDTALCGASCGAAVPFCGNGVTEYGEECDDGGPSETCDAFCNVIEMVDPVPANQFNIGDSIGEGEAANGTVGDLNHEAVWSTGWDLGDVVNSLNERFEARDAAAYAENDAGRDAAINQAVSGAVMADFATQAQAVAEAMAAVPPGTADMVTILLGNNDVCADNLSGMTDPAVFETQFRDGLNVLAGGQFPDDVRLLVSGIPAIYWLWNAKRDNLWCRAFVWPFVPCQNLLDNPADDCASDASANDPDNFYAGDGPNCVRRKQFHAAIRDTYNPIIRRVLADYSDLLPNAEYVDIFDVRFDSVHVNSGDCFHPSKAGHALMSGEQWCRSSWSAGDPACSP
jgi:lysophospholipase L1-like esterase